MPNQFDPSPIKKNVPVVARCAIHGKGTLFRYPDRWTENNQVVGVIVFKLGVVQSKYFSEFKNSNKFNDELIYLHLLKRSADDTNSAPNHVFSKLKKEAKDEFNFKKGDELWMIIDTDRWKNIPKIIERKTFVSQ